MENRDPPRNQLVPGACRRHRPVVERGCGRHNYDIELLRPRPTIWKARRGSCYTHLCWTQTYTSSMSVSPEISGSTVVGDEETAANVLVLAMGWRK